MSREPLWNGMFAENPENAFRLTADSFLLADFASVPQGSLVCDLGCGAGAVGMMLLANDSSVHLIGVEKTPEQAALAVRCIEENGCTDRAQILCADWRDLRGKLTAESFDAAVSNPPYFAERASVSSDSSAYRTEQNGSIDSLCAAAAYLLKIHGTFCLVYRADRLVDLLCALRKARLEPKRMRFVRHRRDSRRILVLVSAVKGGKPSLCLEEDLILYHADGSETDECRRIYHHGKENAL